MPASPCSSDPDLCSAAACSAPTPTRLPSSPFLPPSARGSPAAACTPGAAEAFGAVGLVSFVAPSFCLAGLAGSGVEVA